MYVVNFDDATNEDIRRGRESVHNSTLALLVKALGMGVTDPSSTKCPPSSTKVINAFSEWLSQVKLEEPVPPQEEEIRFVAHVSAHTLVHGGHCHAGH